ncbi:MAG: hypothetical protein KDI67_11515, partial [Gammaproteobacteria bacterium]|nr:hypothetical protein [Gammaproteobacteria bacterium]
AAQVHVESFIPDHVLACSCGVAPAEAGGARIRGFAWLYTIASRTTNSADRREIPLQLRDESQREAR